MEHHFVIADVFTANPFGGNQLAVFPDARGMSDRAMQALTREFNFAESTFVLPAKNPAHARRVRIFTPGAEVPFAGHPTVGTAAVLARLGMVETPGGKATIVLEEGIGPVSVDVQLDGKAVMTRFSLERPVERAASAPRPADAAAALSLPPTAVTDTWFASYGLPFCFIRLTDKVMVDRSVLDRAAWSAAFGRAWASNLFLFAGDGPASENVYARMFAPSLGVPEDAATGSAAAALAGSLAETSPQRTAEFAWRIEQGVAMGRPSLILASAEKRDGKVLRVRVGGTTVIVGDGHMTTPDNY
jgi:trans-2,3-dihydro-3-hydroxyanthranilate isomerase